MKIRVIPCNPWRYRNDVNGSPAGIHSMGTSARNVRSQSPTSFIWLGSQQCVFAPCS